jgi:hypothetical protein
MPWELAKRQASSTICRSYGAHGPLDTNGYKDLAPTEPGFGAAKSLGFLGLASEALLSKPTTFTAPTLP